MEAPGHRAVGTVVTEEEAVQTSPDLLIIEMALAGAMDVWNSGTVMTALLSDQEPSEQVWYWT